MEVGRGQGLPRHNQHNIYSNIAQGPKRSEHVTKEKTL